MFSDFSLAALPLHGKLFVALFTVLFLMVIIWSAVVAAINAGLLGDFENYGDYEAATDIETAMADSEAVTAPDWADSGEQVPIRPEDTLKFKEYEETQLPFSVRFKDNVEWALEHISTQALLYFALGLLFMFTSYSAKTKRFFFWTVAILIFLHVLGLTGHGFCWPANFLLYACGALILILMFVMGVMVLRNLKRKAG